VVLAPTTVLANQHFLTFEKLLQDMPINLQLITASTKADEGGDILIGTSAVLARKDKLIKNLGLLVVDEQHRFGVSQREELLHPFEISNRQPHVLNMTATPIPRTLALALFSELEVSTINTKPKGRLPVKTFVVPEFKRPDSYSWIAKQLSENHEQAFWICPIIEESDVLQVNSAKQTYQHLQNIFPKLNIGLLHGKLTPKQKQEVMSEFAAGDITILVSTSVIEVGIDVPNATIMVIEGAERFGLAQLHQLRGRVGRSHQHSWCFLFPTEDTANTRLTYFASHSDGLKIAEYDLEQRGPGEVYGTRQSGIPNLKIARLNDLSLIKEAKKVADLFFESRIKQIDLF
jgi:ATP-dependent DNA helicase RecG